MVSVEKKQEIIERLLRSYMKLVAFGIEFDEERTAKTHAFFTYPSTIDTSCILANTEYFDESAYVALIRDPKKACAGAVKEFMVNTAALGIAEAASDDIELDWWYEDFNMAWKMLEIKLFAKTRDNCTLTVRTINEAILKESERIDKNLDALLNRWGGYSEV